MRKLLLILILALILVPVVSASDECGLLNLGSCIPEKLYDYFLNILNAPLQPLLDLVRALMTEPVELSLFKSLWAVMLYVISLFYGLLMLYSGFNFMISGYDSARREKAKMWFKDILIMIILVQASYFIYSAVIDISSLLTSGVMSLINEQFFMITADNIVNIGLEFFFSFFYVIVLVIAVIMLTLRYIIVASGVVFAPIGIFLYFIPPLRDYGKLVLNFLGTCIFITFLDSIVFLVCSKLIEITLFESIKILVMITAFEIAIGLMFYFMFFSALKSAFKTGEGAVGTAKTIVSVAKYFV